MKCQWNGAQQPLYPLLVSGVIGSIPTRDLFFHLAQVIRCMFLSGYLTCIVCVYKVHILWGGKGFCKRLVSQCIFSNRQSGTSIICKFSMVCMNCIYNRIKMVVCLIRTRNTLGQILCFFILHKLDAFYDNLIKTHPIYVNWVSL